MIVSIQMISQRLIISIIIKLHIWCVYKSSNSCLIFLGKTQHNKRRVLLYQTFCYSFSHLQISVRHIFGVPINKLRTDIYLWKYMWTFVWENECDNKILEDNIYQKCMLRWCTWNMQNNTWNFQSSFILFKNDIHPYFNAHYIKWSLKRFIIVLNIVLVLPFILILNFFNLFIISSKNISLH